MTKIKQERREFLIANAALGLSAALSCRQGGSMNINDDENPVATVAQGILRGTRSGSVISFKRMPYAKNPFVGVNRFREPQPATSWTGQRDAGDFGPVPPQPSRSLVSDMTGEVDDLTLNVWAPADAHRAPVLVWFPGGAFYRVDASEDWYNGSSFANQGIVVVTVNYRVGIDGFMEIDGMPSNRGLLDQVAALHWVQQNIAAFGGNAKEVTIAGQSAGAGCVMLLMGMSTARGLFNKAIAQSPPQDTLTSAQASEVANATAQSIGIMPTAQAFSAVSIGKLIEAEKQTIANLNKVENWDITSGLLPYSPVVDGTVLTAKPLEALKSAPDRVPLLIGCTDEEWRLFLVPDGSIDRITLADFELEARRSGLPSSAINLYANIRGGTSPGDMLAALKSDTVFRIPTLRFAEQRVTANAPVWLYHFSWSSPGFEGRLGAAHVVDVPFSFNMLATKEAEAVLGGPGYQPLADEMHMHWIRFIKTGDAGWARYDMGTRPIMRFDVVSSVITE